MVNNKNDNFEKPESDKHDKNNKDNFDYDLTEENNSLTKEVELLDKKKREL